MAPFLDAFLLGLLGSAHCLGMCGGFSAAVGASLHPRARLRFAGRMTAYLGGKALTYALFGALAAGFSRGKAGGILDPSVRKAVVLVAAVTILLTGLHTAGWLRLFFHRPFSLLPAGIRAPLRELFRAWTRLPGGPGAAVLGFLNGFLPCGLVVGAVLIAASTGSPARGAGVMLLFGISTGPALLFPALAGRAAARAPRRGIRRLAGLLLVALALWTGFHALRGKPEGGPPPASGAAAARPG
ncbi:MAG: sulfite exporter TauE/SafE family protein [Planctomycetota bacterium]